MRKSLVEHFAVIEDPRSGQVSHDLVEMLVIVTCAMLSEVETFVDIADWARYHESWLRRFLRLENGLPSHDTLNRLFRILNPKVFEHVFHDWVRDVMGAFGQVAIDGKCLRGSGKRSPVHLVSAFATHSGLVLGQQRVADKSSELDAVPELLRALELRGCLVSLDALGCQRQIAQQIKDCGADYLLAVKGNQPSLLATVEGAFMDQPNPAEHTKHQKGHGRQSVQLAQVITNTGYVDPTVWADCKSLARIVSVRVQENKTSQMEIRYYISSAQLDPDELAQAARAHWAVENDLHWRLDVMMREDACVVKRDNAPENLSIIRRIILNLLKQTPDTSPTKRSMSRRRRAAGWDENERARLLGMISL